MDTPSVIKGSINFDLSAIKAAIEACEDLKLDSKTILEQLVKIDDAKKEVKKLKDAFDTAEAEVKAAINTRAKALYGDEWEAIKGNGYKISRSGTGAAYIVETGLDEEATAEDKVSWIVSNPESLAYLKVDVKVDKDLADQHIKDTNELPPKIVANCDRGESIRITVSDK